MTQISSSMRVTDEVKFRKFLRILILSAAAGAFSDFYGNAILGGVAGPLVKSLHITIAQYAGAAGITYLGGVAGALSFGYLADTIGRKRTFILTLAIFIAGVILTAFAFNLYSLYAFRVLTGFGIGADFAPALGMLSEFSPSYRLRKSGTSRGQNLSLFWAIFVIGGIVGYVVSWAFAVSKVGGLLDWRFALATAVIAPAVGLVIRTRIPEPPRWFVLKNRIEDAKKSLDYIGLDRSSIDSYLIPAFKEKTKASEFKPFVMPVLLPLFFSFFLQAIAFTSLTILAPTFLSALGISAVDAVLFTALAFAFPQLVGVLIAFAIIDKVERRTIAWVGNLWGGVSLVLLGLFAHSSVFLLLALLAIADVSNGFVLPVLGGMASEFFTARTRGTGQGISTSAFRWSGFVGGLISPVIVAVYGVPGLFYIFGVFALIAFVISAFWLTKAKVSNRELEDIAEAVAERRTA